MLRHLERSEYCRRQADDCASRAATTKLPEIKDAYHQLELGWRQLVPDFDPVPNISNDKDADVCQAPQPDASVQPKKCLRGAKSSD